MAGRYTNFFDKVESKFNNFSEEDFKAGGYRVVPNAIARKGSFIGKNVVLMPSYVNIGAYVGEGTMVDTWATVGSCAQIGKNVHLSGGVGIGGVLEPIQAGPTIIGDNCFVGARSEVVEGKGAVAVVFVNNENQYEPADIATLKMQLRLENSQSVDGDLQIALNKIADVRDTRYKFYD